MRIWSPKYLRNLKSMGQGSQCHGNYSVPFPPFLPRFPVPPRGQSCDISVHTNAQLSVFANPLQSGLHSSCWPIWKWTNPFCNRSVMNISRDRVWALSLKDLAIPSLPVLPLATWQSMGWSDAVKSNSSLEIKQSRVISWGTETLQVVRA